MDFFSKCNTQEEAKATFKRLCKCFHPDKGGEEALMIDLKNQFDAWQPSYEAQRPKFKFTVNGSSINNDWQDIIYNEKINELNRTLYHLRTELTELRLSLSFEKDRTNAEIRAKYHFQDEMNKQKVLIDVLNKQLEEKREELKGERDRIDSKSLSEKIRWVFGYE